jgi:hypothetical protein
MRIWRMLSLLSSFTGRWSLGSYQNWRYWYHYWGGVGLLFYRAVDDSVSSLTM